MRIAPEHIELKQLAGKTKDGDNIVYVVTKGGLHSFFTKKDNEIITLGAAPHKAIAIWLAEKKNPGIEWDRSFKLGEMAKSELDIFEKLRAHIFSQKEMPLEKMEKIDAFILYNTLTKTIMVMREDEIKKALPEMKGIDKTVIRPIDLSEPVDFLRYHRFNRK